MLALNCAQAIAHMSFAKAYFNLELKLLFYGHCFLRLELALPGQSISQQHQSSATLPQDAVANATTSILN